MKTKTKKTPALAYPTFAAGQVLEYKHGCKYRVEVAAQVGPVIFAHSVFTTGVVQRVGSLQALDVRDLEQLQAVKAGVPWDNGYSPETKPRYSSS